jgi:membrane-bound metal-dependent hydrolase YbcI (DUF457 family)
VRTGPLAAGAGSQGMMARSHVVLGAAGWLTAAVVVEAVTGRAFEPVELAAGTVVCAGAAVLPDCDEPNALVASALGPITRWLARGIRKVAGGHRQGTHSLEFGLFIGLGSWTLGAVGGWWATLAMAFLCCAFALRAAGPARHRPGGYRWIVVALQAAVLTWTGAVIVPDGWVWLPFAITAGCWLHLLGDMLTPEGAPLLWPWPWRLSVPIVARTGNGTEQVITALTALWVGWLVWQTTAQPLLGWGS